MFRLLAISGMSNSISPHSVQLVQEEVDGGDSTVASDDEVSSGVSWQLAWTARYPLDPSAIAYFLGLCNWLVLKIRVSSTNRARNSIDLVGAAMRALVGIVGEC